MNLFFYNIFIPIIAGLIMNGIIYTFKLNKNLKISDKSILPPGYVVGSVWIILLGLLGYVHYMLYNMYEGITITSILVIIFIIFCILYPVIVNYNPKITLLMNLFSLVFVFVLGLFIIKESTYVFLFIIPLLAWLILVSISDILVCSDITLKKT